MYYWRRPPLDEEGQAASVAEAKRLLRESPRNSLEEAIEAARAARRKFVPRSKSRGAAIADWVIAWLYEAQAEEEHRENSATLAVEEKHSRRFSLAIKLLEALRLNINEFQSVVKACSLKLVNNPKAVTWAVADILKHIDDACVAEAARVFDSCPGEAYVWLAAVDAGKQGAKP